jgi:hypothetical protein
MSEPTEKLFPASPEDIADAIAFALRFRGRKRMHDADELMSRLVAERLVEFLAKAGFVVMQRPPPAPHGGNFGQGERARPPV